MPKLKPGDEVTIRAASYVRFRAACTMCSGAAVYCQWCAGGKLTLIDDRDVVEPAGKK